MSIKIENVVLPSADQWRAIIMGCRNPLNSWNKSDTIFEQHELEAWPHNVVATMESLGAKDLELMKKLSSAGTDHRKFMRMIPVYLDIIAPLYFWKEMDTYSVGKVQNSCSTMHKIADKEFTLEDFSCEHLTTQSKKCLEDVIKLLNMYRALYISKTDKCVDQFTIMSDECYTKYKKDIWWQMIQLLPSSYNQRRTVMLNYEVLANIYKSRRNHKLDEWHTFCDWIESLPYSELIRGTVK